MYTYRKKIQLSHSATIGFSDVNILSLSGFGTNKIADVEVKATLYDVANQKSSIIYYRNVQIVDPAVTVLYTGLADSSFSYAEDNITAAHLFDITYNQSSSSIIIRAANTTATTLNTICIIDYKINFY
jgi:hypothetical protein